MMHEHSGMEVTIESYLLYGQSYMDTTLILLCHDKVIGHVEMRHKVTIASHCHDEQP